MNLRQLRYFVVVAEALNFRRAAERLHISQPPLTVGIRKLEEELGAPLFNRTTRGLSLTPAGEDALPLARLALFQAEQMRQAVRARTDEERGHLNIGFSDATAPLLRRLLPAFHRRHPKVDVMVTEMSGLELVRRLRIRKMDVGLVRLPLSNPAHIEASVVAHEELVVALAETHPLTRRGPISLAALHDAPLIAYPHGDPARDLLLDACQHAGFEPHITQEVATASTILALVQMGLGIGIVPADTKLVPDGVRLVRLADPITVEIGFATPRDANNRLAAMMHTLAMTELASTTMSHV
jgi:DNA-binding transcriptional LysR family regulator